MPKNNKKTKQENENNHPLPTLGAGGFIGIVLVAAGFFNLPAILKKPVTNADWMMLVIVLFFIFLGLAVLLLPRILRKK
ncbi:MAG: hypothetical protein AB9907_12030 [Flexilinea sp.]